MENSITKPQSCLVLKGGVEIWIDNEKIGRLKAEMQRGSFVTWGEDYFNVSETNVVGIFSANTMEEKRRRFNGQWRCQHGNWHDRGEKCLCIPKDRREWNERLLALIAACGKCKEGWIFTDRGARRCECCAHFFTANGTAPKDTK